MNIQILEEHGIDYASGVARCTNDAGFYEMLLTMFLQDDTFARAKAAYGEGDMKELFNCMHELKGAAGNASLTDMYKASVPLVEALRCEQPRQDEIDGLFVRAQQVYDRTCEGISAAIGK